MSKKNKIEPISTGIEFNAIYTDIKTLIVEARTTVAKQVNQVLTVTYWQIGKLIQTKILNSGRAEYGDATIKKLSKELTKEFGKGVGYRNLIRMSHFYNKFQDIQIVTTLSAKLSWSHFVEIIKLDNDIQRDFYNKNYIKLLRRQN